MWTLDFPEFAYMATSDESTTVGRSDRTRWKLRLLNKIFGREIGVLNLPQFADVPGSFWVDLTSGNAASLGPGEWIISSSAAIMLHHARYGRNRKPVRIVLYEKAPRTYKELLDNLAVNLPALGYERIDEAHWKYGSLVDVSVRNADSATFDPAEIPPDWAVQIVNDPNTVNGWAMDPGLMAAVKKRSRLCLGVSTMGCNANGSKRLNREEREIWFKHVQSQIEGLHKHHDLLLAAIERDSHQWAYLITAPAAWKEEVSRDARGAFARGGFQLNCVWLRSDPEKFQELLNILFLTKSERES
jgi:hypothetical protein